MKPLGPDEGMNALRHPDCRFCDEYKLLLRGPTEEVRQLKAKLAKLEAATPTQPAVPAPEESGDEDCSTPRKYTIVRDSWRSDQRWRIQGGEEIGRGLDGAVTAYDARDVDPLVEAARNIFARFGAMGTHDAKLAAALEPFAAQAEEGKR